MAFANDSVRLLVAHYLDLDRCVLLGPDTALIPSPKGTRDAGTFSCSTRDPRNAWLLELYDEDYDPVRVLIAGDDGTAPDEWK